LNITCLIAIPNDSLMDRALGSVISGGGSEINLVKSTANEMAELIEEISDKRADVVVLTESSPLAGKDGLISLLMSFPELRIVVVSEDTNWLYVFHKRDLLMSQRADFRNAIYFDCLDQVPMA
jgi:hypothetical protein